jgi:molecular chaperone GrpE
MIRTTGKKREDPGPDGEGPEGPKHQDGSQERSHEGGPDGGAAAQTGEGTGQAVLGEMEALQEEVDRLKDQHLRLAADFENYRKRANAELAGAWGRAQADLVKSLVEALDDLERVSRFTSEDATVDTLVGGVDLVERKLLKTLTDAGLEILNPEGEVFDPTIMEAVMIVPLEEGRQDETVHQVFQKGYLFKDQLVRPARVSVYKNDD